MTPLVGQSDVPRLLPMAALAGRAQGRSSRDETTLFESLGLGVEDVAAAHVVVRNAERTRAGTRFELGGARRG